MTDEGSSDLTNVSSAVSADDDEGFRRTAITAVGATEVSRGESVDLALRGRYLDEADIAFTFQGRLMVMFVPFEL